MFLRKIEAIRSFNELGHRRTPFVFFTDFSGERSWVKPTDQIDNSELLYDIDGNTNSYSLYAARNDFIFTKIPVSQDVFKDSFDKVVDHILFGNSFLVNLTFRTSISFNISPEELFHLTHGRFKILWKKGFLVFSPEPFVVIGDDGIFSYPMKGTIDASIPDAAQLILNDQKELAEHITIVDLIRNDLSQVSKSVKVNRFRYIEEVKTHEKTLLQVSSEIAGKIKNNWRSELGDIIYQLLPAGSISGAPKPKTIEIIQEVEKNSRGFYTGICGLYDGEKLVSGVMIRFIEFDQGQYYFRSGGGITSASDLAAEYREMIDKVYVPVY